ncbi:MAG: group II intron reverse transcriptase/maturase [Acidobacteria bacterium RBG_16_64_8]|nr:MAG: group II intron reverse transcriptase/maturase [Acidobacteria bacterium RBG_16_64_8]
MSFTSLAHHIDLRWLQEAYHRTRKDGATGVDNQTAADYEKNLEENLRSLLERAKSGSYRAPPVRRTYIPKGTSRTEMRPIGVPTFEDKVLQRAVVMVLEPLYEQEFLDCSYGFRPGRSAHDALDALWKQTMDVGGGWVIDLDIRKFFDTLDHKHLREILKRRVSDGVLSRLIGKWLNAGVCEKGAVSYPGQGSPQGGVVSPMLSNVYLHEVLDEWFEEAVKPRLKGKAFVVRYADDAVLGFEYEEDARRVMEVLPKRFAKYGLTIHPEKTRVVRFQRPDRGNPEDQEQPKRETFNFLGFTHSWRRSRNGNWVVKRTTERGRLARALKKVGDWCRRNRHAPIQEQYDHLQRKLQGHYSYYGITGNYNMLATFRNQVIRIWKVWLSRRSNNGWVSWEKLRLLLERFSLAPPRVVHSIYSANL